MKKRNVLAVPMITLSLLAFAPPIARSAEAPPAAAPADKSMAAVLQPFVDARTLAGAVTLVASADKVLSLEAVGYEDVAAKRAMRADDLFWIASMSKPMTATALMMLVDDGKVNVDEPVEKYLPEFRGQMVAVEQDGEHVLLKKPTHAILVREVLSHTSGLPFMSRVEHRIDERPLREAALSYAMTPLKTEPFTAYAYSNAGINSAGRIIEVVSGMPYEQFMQKRLFKPLGMKDTAFVLTEPQLARLAKSYKPNTAKNDLEETDVSQLTYPLTRTDRYPCPAGGLFSTAADVGAFGQLILGGGEFRGKRLVSTAAVQQMTSTQTGDIVSHGKGENGYGFGFSTTRKAHGEPTVANLSPAGHGGAYATDLWIDPPHGLVLVYMVQHAGFPGNGGSAAGAFKKVAIEAYGKEQR